MYDIDTEAFAPHDAGSYPFAYEEDPAQAAAWPPLWSDPVGPGPSGPVAWGAGVPRPRAPHDPYPHEDPPVEHPEARGAPLRAPRRAPAHRRTRSMLPQRVSLAGLVFGALTATTFTAVCLISWTLSYHPLEHLAAGRVPGGLSQLWPVVLYGPWLAGCLSVLRAALDGRRVVHSWVVLSLLSGSSAGLCTAGAADTLPGMVVAGLPPLTAFLCLQQLVSQLRYGPIPAPRGRRRVR